ncbi:MAG: ATP-binding protein [Thiohalocapsa sp.]
MSSAFLARHAPVARRIEEVSGIRPVTLLIASGIALIIAILLATGIATNDLREKTQTHTEGELARIDALLASASNQMLSAIDAQLGDIADRLGRADGDLRQTAATPEIAALLQNKLTHVRNLAAVAIVGPDGAALAHAGAWPAADAVPPRRTGGTLGAPVRDRQTGAIGIPLVHRLAATQEGSAGSVIGIVAAPALGDLFASSALPPDARISLLRADGMLLVRSPDRPDRIGQIGKAGDIGALFVHRNVPMVRQAKAADGSWRLEALHALPDFPAAVSVSRNAEQALGGWTHQGMWFAGFAVVVAMAIGIMVYLIARQFETHAALAAIRADNAIAALNAEKIEVERARLAAEAELLKSERLSVLGQLTATVAHELRNPLSAIRNTLFTVKELATGGGLKLDRPIGRMERSIERCDRIISDLLEYTRNRDLNRSSVAFDAWLAEVASEQHVAAPVVLESELAADGALVPIDPDRMRRVIINLVENATHALAELPPDRDKRITLRTMAADEELTLTITDTGPGIAPDTLQRIFEPLFSTKSFGTGLGLPTVKQIVNQHGGVIEVDSFLGSGTTVRVRLPLAAETVADMKAAA